MIGRDIVSEALAWRAGLPHVKASETRLRLYEVVRPLSDIYLVEAFNLWWYTYSTGIRLAPSNKPGQGVNEYDATRAGKIADEVVIAQFEGLAT